MKQAMIFAAGVGSRMKHLTTNKPKALVEIRGKTLLQHAIEYLCSYGFCNIIINTHHFSQQIIDFIHNFKKEGIKITISDESKLLLNNGGGLKKAAPFFVEDSFLLYNVDVLTNMNLNKLLEQHVKMDALATLAVRNRKTSRYLLFDKNGLLQAWENISTGEIKPSIDIKNAERLAFSGIQIVSKKIVDLIEEEGSFSIIDLYLRLAKEYKIFAYNHNDSLWMDTGTPERLKTAASIDALFV